MKDGNIDMDDSLFEKTMSDVFKEPTAKKQSHKIHLRQTCSKISNRQPNRIQSCPKEPANRPQTQISKRILWVCSKT